MPKLGKYEYPDSTLSESLELGARIAREYAGEVSRAGLARALGMSERGGAFAARVGALRMWGIASGRGTLRVTRDGLRACSPIAPDDALAARTALARSVPLIAELSARLGSHGPDTARLALVTEEVTGAGHTLVRRHLAKLERVYAEAVKLMHAPIGSASVPLIANSPAAQTTGSGSTRVPPAQADTAQAVAPAAPVRATPVASDIGRVELLLPGGAISLPENVANLDAMLTVLWAHRQLVAARQASAGAPSNSNPPDFVLRAARKDQTT